MPTPQSGEETTPRPRRRRWLWFAAGFLVVFVVLSVTVTAYPLSRRGDAVEVRPLWEYYLIEIRRAAGSNGTMGPTSGSSGAALTMLLQHVLASAAGGALVLGARWAVLRARGRSG